MSEVISYVEPCNVWNVDPVISAVAHQAWLTRDTRTFLSIFDPVLRAVLEKLAIWKQDGNG